jgi:hypothetical protein
MKIRDIFGLVVRIIFVLIAVYGLIFIISGIANAVGLSTGTEGSPKSQCIYGGIIMLIGIALLWLTPRIVKITYPEAPPPKSTDQNVS